MKLGKLTTDAFNAKSLDEQTRDLIDYLRTEQPSLNLNGAEGDNLPWVAAALYRDMLALSTIDDVQQSYPGFYKLCQDAITSRTATVASKAAPVNAQLGAEKLELLSGAYKNFGNERIKTSFSGSY